MSIIPDIQAHAEVTLDQDSWQLKVVQAVVVLVVNSGLWLELTPFLKSFVGDMEDQIQPTSVLFITEDGSCRSLGT